VQTSLRDANDRCFECLLVTDAAESYFPKFKATAIGMIVAQGGVLGACASYGSGCAAGAGWRLRSPGGRSLRREEPLRHRR